MSDNKSWFYLTLWRGTPPQFTERVNAEIQKSLSMDTSVILNNAIDSKIEKSNSFISKISTGILLDAEITKKIEVIWHVG